MDKRNDIDTSILTHTLELAPMKEGDIIEVREYIRRLRAFNEYGIKNVYVVDKRNTVYSFSITDMIYKFLEDNLIIFGAKKVRVCFSKSNRLYFEPVENGS